MKNYQKAQVIAKNNTTGSYAAGCPVKDRRVGWLGTDCRTCEVSK